MGDEDELKTATEFLACLSPAELEIARLVAKGLTSKEIACRICRAQSTVKNVLSGIYTAMGEANRVKLARHVWVWESAR